MVARPAAVLTADRTTASGSPTALGEGQALRTKNSFPRDERRSSTRRPRNRRASVALMAERIEIEVTQGNLSNNHRYLRGHLDFFPVDAIGAANRHDGEGRLLTVHFDGVGTVTTDIAGGKEAVAQGPRVVTVQRRSRRARRRPPEDPARRRRVRDLAVACAAWGGRGRPRCFSGSRAEVSVRFRERQGVVGRGPIRAVP